MKLPITYRAFNSGGPGGQHQNRSFNAIEASVDVPGIGRITATASTKSQARNKVSARRVLAARVAAAIKASKAAEQDRRRTAGFGPQGRVRTYALHRACIIDTAGFRLPWTGEIDAAIERRCRALLEVRTNEHV